MKIYLDDERTEPTGWVRCRTAFEAIELLANHDVEEISLDHDLGNDEKFGTGKTVISWLEEHSFTNPEYIIPIIHVHSANPIGRKYMEMGIAQMEKWRKERI
jgi:hypothetical protein